MLVIQHRVNELGAPAFTDVAEIDVHIDKYGRILVKHCPDEEGSTLSYYLSSSKHKKFFVDIKQNLSVEHYKKIIKAFGDRLFGLFDIPMPAAYFTDREGIDFYHRLSQFEDASYLSKNSGNKYWLDPLGNWPGECDLHTYSHLLGNILYSDFVVIACPSLHNRGLQACIDVWKLAAGNKDKVVGIVTKYPKECREIVSDGN